MNFFLEGNRYLSPFFSFLLFYFIFFLFVFFFFYKFIRSRSILLMFTSMIESKETWSFRRARKRCKSFNLIPHPTSTPPHPLPLTLFDWFYYPLQAIFSKTFNVLSLNIFLFSFFLSFRSVSESIWRETLLRFDRENTREKPLSFKINALDQKVYTVVDLLNVR